MPYKSRLKSLELKILICDRSKYINDLWSQFGLSILADCSWEDGQKRRILFDTGWEAEPLLHNMDKENISIDSIDSLVLSHCHYDHTGGLDGFIGSEEGRFNLIAHKDIVRPVYSLLPEIHYIGLDEKLLNSLSRERLMLVSDETQIYNGVWITGTIPRITDFEEPEEDVYVLEDGRLLEDMEEDDMALVFDLGEDGIVVVSGCSHAGIVNTLYHSMKITNNNKIQGLVGGFHLIDLTDEVRTRTVDELGKIEIEGIWSGHCTGHLAEHLLGEKFGGRHRMFYTGDEMKFSSGKK